MPGMLEEKLAGQCSEEKAIREGVLKIRKVREKQIL